MKQLEKGNIQIINVSGSFSKIWTNQTVFKAEFTEQAIALNTFSLTHHAKLVHGWAKQANSLIMERLTDNKLITFKNYYQKKMDSLQEVLLVAYVSDCPVAFLEVFQFVNVKLAKEYKTGGHDYGIYLIFPNHKDILPILHKEARNVFKNVLLTILQDLFYNTPADNILVVREAANKKVAMLLKKIGFTLVKSLVIDTVAARLYNINRKDYLEKYP